MARVLFSNESGTSVTHAYTAPGSYEVTVNSADALANSSSATGTIMIPSMPTSTTTTTTTTTTATTPSGTPTQPPSISAAS
jgi:PKD domain